MSGRGVWGKADGLYNEVQCIMGDGLMPPLPCCGQDENINFPQVRWWAVILGKLTRFLNQKII